MIRSVEKGEEYVSVEFSDGATAHYDFLWLRDHATDPGSYDSRSHQRELYTAGIDKGISPVEVSVTAEGEALLVSWPDVDGPVAYPAEFLAAYGKPLQQGSLFSGSAAPWERGPSRNSRRLPFRRLCQGLYQG